MFKLNRNEPCPCGSGKKYKKCCFLEPLKEDEIQRALTKSTSLAEVQALLSEPAKLYHIKVELVRHPCHDLDHKEVSRTFLIAGIQSLYNLHRKIQRAFRWDNDHMFSFYLSNKLHDRSSEYSAAPDGKHYPSRMGEPTKAASDAELRDLDLKEGQQFLYLFDYGDQLLHQVTILEITETDQHKPVAFQLTGSVGDNVDQYHAYDEDPLEESADDSDITGNLMTTTQAIPEAPSITNERQYIEWFVQYSDKLTDERKHGGAYAQGERLKAFVAEHTDRALDLMKQCPDQESYLARVKFMASDTQVKITAMLDEFGGLENCPEPLKLLLIGLLIHIAIGVEMLDKKYLQAMKERLVPEFH